MFRHAGNNQIGAFLGHIMLDANERSAVITRPLAQALPFAQRLESLGLPAVIFPLLEIAPLGDTHALQATLQSIADFSLVMFVSPNAIDAALPFVPEWPAHVAIAVVGEGSRLRLAYHGLTPENTRIFCPAPGERMDSESLMRRLDIPALQGKGVLIVRGETGRNFLTDMLRQAGVRVHQLPAYCRQAPAMTANRQHALQQLAQGNYDWIITSSEALRILKQQVQTLPDATGLANLLRQRLLVSHPRIGEVAAELGFLQVELTDSGDDALIAALQLR